MLLFVTVCLVIGSVSQVSDFRRIYLKSQLAPDSKSNAELIALSVQELEKQEINTEINAFLEKGGRINLAVVVDLEKMSVAIVTDKRVIENYIVSSWDTAIVSDFSVQSSRLVVEGICTLFYDTMSTLKLASSSVGTLGVFVKESFLQKYDLSEKEVINSISNRLEEYGYFVEVLFKSEGEDGVRSLVPVEAKNGFMDDSYKDLVNVDSISDGQEDRKEGKDLTGREEDLNTLGEAIYGKRAKEEHDGERGIGESIKDVVAFCAKKYKVQVGEGAILFLSSNSQVGENLVLEKNSVLVVTCIEESKAKVKIGDNVSILASIEINVEGMGELTIEDNSCFDKNLKLAVKTDDIVFLGQEGMIIVKKSDGQIIDNILNQLYMERVESLDRELLLKALDHCWFYLQGLPVDEEYFLKYIEDRLSEKAAMLFINASEKVRKENIQKNKKGVEEANIDSKDEEILLRDISSDWPKTSADDLRKAEKESDFEAIVRKKVEIIRKLLLKKIFKKTFNVEYFKIDQLLEKST